MTYDRWSKRYFIHEYSTTTELKRLSDFFGLKITEDRLNRDVIIIDRENPDSSKVPIKRRLSSTNYL